MVTQSFRSEFRTEANSARPCPFYQQGHCFFGDSCNFMHDVSVKDFPDPTFISAPSKASFPNLPVVTVNSPPRSPRMSDLLFALRDVIGDEPEGEPEDALEGSTYINSSNTSEEYVTAGVASQRIHEGETTVGDSGSTAMGAVPVDDDTLSVLPENHPSRNSPPNMEHPPTSFAEPVDASDLLSPVNLLELNLTAFTDFENKSSSRDEGSIDSGYADTWAAPQPFARTPPPNALNSTFDLLSSPFGAPASRVLSPRLSAFMSRQPASPFDPALSVADGPADLSLDSPGKELNGRVLVDGSPPNFPGLFEATGGPITDSNVEGDPGEDSRWDRSEDQTTTISLRMPSLSPKEVDDAIIQSSTTPTHFLMKDVDFIDGEATSGFSSVSCSPSVTPSKNRDSELVDVSLFSSLTTIEREVHPQADPSDTLVAPVDEVGTEVGGEKDLSGNSLTAELAYPTSPTVPSNENDTVNLIYDDYSSPSNARDISTVLRINTDISPSPKTIQGPLSAKTPAWSDHIHDRVFTPPLVHRGRSETFATDSPISLPSPRVFSDAAYTSRLSSQSPETRSVWSPDSSILDMRELPASKKIPFGFRHSRPVVRDLHLLSSCHTNTIFTGPHKDFLSPLRPSTASA